MNIDSLSMKELKSGTRRDGTRSVSKKNVNWYWWQHGVGDILLCDQIFVHPSLKLALPWFQATFLYKWLNMFSSILGVISLVMLAMHCNTTNSTTITHKCSQRWIKITTITDRDQKFECPAYHMLTDRRTRSHFWERVTEYRSIITWHAQNEQKPN